MFDGMQPQQHQHKAARRRTGQVFDVRATEKETSGSPRLTEVDELTDVEELAACPKCSRSARFRPSEQMSDHRASRLEPRGVPGRVVVLTVENI
jgi:hypothetical protein